MISIANDRIEDEGRQLYDIAVPTVGSFKFGTLISRRYEIPNSFSAVRSYSVNIDFEEVRSIEEVLEISTSFDLLMGFLIGHRPKSPIFDVQTNDGQKGELEVSYLEFGNNELTNHFTATHLNGIGDASLSEIMIAFYKKRDLFRRIIYCVDMIRFFSNNVVDKFRVIMPVLENYLRQKYKDKEQESFLERKSQFFKIVDCSTEEIREFCKRHVSIRESKSLGLKNVLAMAIEELNQSGYDIDLGFADRVNGRRGSLFHSDVEIGEGEILDVYDETLAMAAMLMLLAMRDLGLDIGAIAVRPNAFRDLRRVCGPKLSGGRDFPLEVS